MTIVFYIDNLILDDKKLVITTKYIKILDTVYSSKDLFTITRGKFYEHLGISIDFLIKGRCSII